MTSNTTLTTLKFQLAEALFGPIVFERTKLTYCPRDEFCRSTYEPDESWFRHLEERGWSDEQIMQQERWVRSCEGHETPVEHYVGMLRNYTVLEQTLDLIIHPQVDDKLVEKVRIRINEPTRLQLNGGFGEMRWQQRQPSGVRTSFSISRWNRW